MNEVLKIWIGENISKGEPMLDIVYVDGTHKYVTWSRATGSLISMAKRIGVDPRGIIARYFARRNRKQRRSA